MKRDNKKKEKKRVKSSKIVMRQDRIELKAATRQFVVFFSFFIIKTRTHLTSTFCFKHSLIKRKRASFIIYINLNAQHKQTIKLS